ncbi:signal transduction histidine kinase [Isoptericola variabilis J7]|uniref:sensor histidine kinase n=2 Tax=Isoptericola variabilis TaxID=139208 RepID=UPI0011AAB597|nr:histidine kinase [Isoptericola variabilis]TWH34523.1 signal transduction histidine kinase [Isoptericola variabilis J7]
MDRGPLDRRRPRLFLAVALAVVVVVGTSGASHWRPGSRDLDALGLALALVPPLVVATLPRRADDHPLLAAVLAAAGALGTYLSLGYAWGPVVGAAVAVLVMVVLTGPARRARVLAWAGAAVVGGAVVAAATLRDDAPRPAGLLGGAAWTVVALLIAGAIRERVARAAALRAAREERERTAVATERLRIAREVHDVLAHSLSAINVQAGVGLHLLERDPEQARSALTSIKATSRDALDEVRAVLGVVRGEAGEPRTPTWDLGGLDRLAGPLRDRGVDVTLDVDLAVHPSPPAQVPRHLVGVAYRVVQEALTNVGRHAPGASAVVVHVGRDDESDPAVLRVRVSDDGGPVAPGPPGYGLRGMRERVEGVGGTLRAGPQGPGFVVDATIPIPRHPSELSGPRPGIPARGPDSSGAGEGGTA